MIDSFNITKEFIIKNSSKISLDLVTTILSEL